MTLLTVAHRIFGSDLPYALYPIPNRSKICTDLNHGTSGPNTLRVIRVHLVLC